MAASQTANDKCEPQHDTHVVVVEGNRGVSGQRISVVPGYLQGIWILQPEGELRSVFHNLPLRRHLHGHGFHRKCLVRRNIQGASDPAVRMRLPGNVAIRSQQRPVRVPEAFQVHEVHDDEPAEQQPLVRRPVRHDHVVRRSAVRQQVPRVLPGERKADLRPAYALFHRRVLHASTRVHLASVGRPAGEDRV